MVRALFVVCFLFLSTALGSRFDIALDLLTVKNKDIPTDLAALLEHDAFELLDEDQDGVLSPEEWRLFMEDSAQRVYGGLSSEDIERIKMNPMFPVFEVSENVAEKELQWICSLAREMAKTDLTKFWDRIAKEPEVLLQTALHLAREPVEPKTFEDFQGFESKVKMVKFAKKVIIPEECSKVGIRRRLWWSTPTWQIAPVIIGGAVAGIGECIKNKGCDSRSDKAFRENYVSWFEKTDTSRREFAENLYNAVFNQEEFSFDELNPFGRR